MQPATNNADGNAVLVSDVNHNSHEKLPDTTNNHEESAEESGDSVINSGVNTPAAAAAATVAVGSALQKQHLDRDVIKKRLTKFKEDFHLSSGPINEHAEQSDQHESSSEQQQQQQKALNPLADEFVPRGKPFAPPQQQQQQQQQQQNEFVSFSPIQQVMQRSQYFPIATMPAQPVYYASQFYYPVSTSAATAAAAAANSKPQFIYHQQQQPQPQFFLQPMAQQQQQQLQLQQVQPTLIGAPGTAVYITPYGQSVIFHQYQQ